MGLWKVLARIAIALTVLSVVVLAGLVVTVAALDRTSDVISSGGVERDYLIHVPESYDPGSPAPLVMSFHAAAMWPASQRKTSGWNDVADRFGFIVVYPGGAGRPRVWQPTVEGARRDARFVSDLLDSLQDRYSIDASRVYANGLSNGGHMAFVLSCELEDRITAVGTVAGAHQLPWSWCQGSRSVPLIAFHGTADPLVPYDGGPSSIAADPFPSAPGFAAAWARRNGCAMEPTTHEVATDVVRVGYSDCADNGDVVFYSLVGGGHTWPGGTTALGWLVGRTTTSVDASAVMWDFFTRHHLESHDRNEVRR